MAADDKEKSTEETAAQPSPSPSAALPPRALRALARAREAAKADHERKDGRWLAVVPVAIGALLLLLMMPRATAPDAVPLPAVNVRALAQIAAADDARAAAAETERLPSDILAVGTATRALNGAEARGADEAEMFAARQRLDASLRDVAHRPDVATLLVSLRAIQLRRFLDALTQWESTGETTEDFIDLGASFIERAADAGWVDGRKLLLSDLERRVMFKTVWNVLTGIDGHPEAAVTLDEQRALYKLYIAHPHPAESRRYALLAQRKDATTAELCARANLEQHRSAQLWLADKIKKLGSIDPAYPTEYALGVVYYRAGRFELSADAFTAYIGKHPDGAYALRAKNHLKAALAGGIL